MEAESIILKKGDKIKFKEKFLPANGEFLPNEYDYYTSEKVCKRLGLILNTSIRLPKNEGEVVQDSNIAREGYTLIITQHDGVYGGMAAMLFETKVLELVKPKEVFFPIY